MSVSADPKRVESQLDLFSTELVADPYPALDELRELSPAVYMSCHDYWLLTRYADVKAATKDWQTYTSAQGVGLLPLHNQNLIGTVLASDPPEHDTLRAVLSDKLTPRALRDVHDQVNAKAVQIVTDLVGRRRFDGVVDLARVFPVNVVADLIGLPMQGRERLHPGADASFTAFGPATAILEERLPVYQTYYEYIYEVMASHRLAPRSWGADLQAAVEAGRLTLFDATSTLGTYLAAGMDTTVNAIAAMLQLFAERPDIWEALRRDPSLGRAALEETLRIETPIQGFFRVTTRDTAVGTVTIPAGQRVMLHWGRQTETPGSIQILMSSICTGIPWTTWHLVSARTPASARGWPDSRWPHCSMPCCRGCGASN